MESSIICPIKQRCLPPEMNETKKVNEYRNLYHLSVSQPEKFWKKISKEFYIHKEQANDREMYNCNFNIDKGPIKIKWMEGSKTNITYNCLDRHVQSGLGNAVAIYWEGNDPRDSSKLTYKQLLESVCKFAATLKSLGVGKGERVMIYMPMIPEQVVAMLACARIGAVHCIVFPGFSPQALCTRLHDCGIKLVVTADGFFRGTKFIPLKAIVEDAFKLLGQEIRCVIVQHLPNQSAANENKTPVYKPPFYSTRDSWWHELMEKAPTKCPVEWVDAEDPLFIISTSGSTGKPKHVLHTVWGYLIYTAFSFKYTMDIRPGDIFWTSGDLGWILGHTYGVYGPLLNGISTVLYEGTPTHPNVSRYWAIIEKYGVTQFYTAPTAVRMLMAHGDEPVKSHDLSSLRVLACSGEPLNPQAWEWYFKVVGSSKAVIADVYWQTETGSTILFPLPVINGRIPSAVPFFGIVPHLIDKGGALVKGEGEGFLVVSEPWPGMARTLFRDHRRFEETYFAPFPGYYFTGDWARRDADGGLTVLGRVDDMLNVSGHLLSTSEIESALAEHPAVAEAAAVPIPHRVKGEALFCFVTLKGVFVEKEDMVAELKGKVREKIGGFAVPDTIRICSVLPKTRSGKVMRRVLRHIATGGLTFGDTSSMEDPTVIHALVNEEVAS